MSENTIHAIVMPKWGLSMQEGRIAEWTVELGTSVRTGDEILDVETDKIAGSMEATDSGALRRIVAESGDTLPVGALLGVLVEGDVDDAAIDAFIAEFQANFVPPSDDEEQSVSAYERIDLNGGAQSIRYAKRGDSGSPVVLIHGFGGDLDNWLFNLDDLAASHTVYALDLPGHGQSSKTVGEGSIASLAQTVVDFLDALDIERAHLVGHSMGGAIGLQIACEHPERVSSLALVCSAGLGESINQAYIDGFIEAQGRRDIKPVLQQLFADESLVSRQMIDDVLKAKRLDGVSDALRTIASSTFVEGRQRTVFRDRLESVSAPVQVIWGARDRIVSADHANDLPASVRVERIAEAGHMVQMEAAKTVNRLLLEHFGGN